MTEEESEGENQYYQEDSHKAALEATMKAMIQMPFTPGNDFAKPHHRMRQMLGIAKNQIKHPAE